MGGGGLGAYEPGEWSDDTQMAVLIARVSATGVDLRSADALDEIALAFEEWFGGGPSDVGIQTSAVLGAAAQLDGHEAGRLTRASRDYYERTDRAAGNGALMRTFVDMLPSRQESNQMRFSGRTVVVTGSGSGIGAETARRFAAEGANAVIADINMDASWARRCARSS
jgi:hypothetical protein